MIEFNGADFIWVDGVYGHDAVDNCFTTETGGGVVNRHVFLTNCYFDNHYTEGESGWRPGEDSVELKGPIDCVVAGNIIKGAYSLNLEIEGGDHVSIVGNKLESADGSHISLDLICNNISIVGNTFKSADSAAVGIGGDNRVVVEGNTMVDCGKANNYAAVRIGAQDGTSPTDLVISNNSIYDCYYGIRITDTANPEEGVIEGNVIDTIVSNGLYLRSGTGLTVEGNQIINAGTGGNGDGMELETSDSLIKDNYINTIETHGIDLISGSGNVFKDNRLVNITGNPFRDLSDNPQVFQSVSFQFTEAVTGSVSTTSPIGVDVDAVGEEALAWGQLPEDLQKVMKIKIWAVSTGAPVGAGGNMHLEVVFNAGASGEDYNLAENSFDLTDFDSEEADYAAGDVVHWVIEDGDVSPNFYQGHPTGGDNFEIKAVGEGSADPDGATDGVFRVVEIEYV